MAIFCVVLATAAFLLTAVPQACRCDRSDQRNGNDLALRAMLSNDNGLEGNIWQSIRERFMNGDGNNNLISSAKPAHDIPSNPSESMMLLESLINRYRKYVVERFVRFDDACSVVLFGGGGGSGETAANDDTVDNELRSETSRTRVASIGLLEGSPGKGSGDGESSFRPEINGLFI
uniref:Uncharacterized protein n=1 Tax=Anopheles maculatus TaxID=74869 RepID=A0A182S9G4_9DIPT